jgi:hypothetical protein
LASTTCVLLLLLLLLAGHFGGAWYRQKIDFSAFPGAVLATTNCVLDPPKAYKNRLFTTNEVSMVLQMNRLSAATAKHTDPAVSCVFLHCHVVLCRGNSSCLCSGVILL